jgi:uncharacterized protein YqjF (DUF2071 family)
MPLRRDVSDARRQPRTLAVHEHRPWPLPDRPWLQGQTWHHLLFAHWPVDPDILRPLIHPAIPIDLWEGQAWIGVTPFEVGGAHPRRLPPVPPVASFPELNVRTYSTIDGKPGIWFLSLDAASALAVIGARRGYRLPYFRARMKIEPEREVEYASRRLHGPHAEFLGSYAPAGPVYQAELGTIDHWLTERYCLYTVDEQGRVLRGDIHHPPWPLQRAEARIERNTMTAPYGIELRGDPLLHFGRRQDVIIWSLERA